MHPQRYAIRATLPRSQHWHGHLCERHQRPVLWLHRYIDDDGDVYGEIMGADMRRSGATFSTWWFDRLAGIAVHRPSNKSTERQDSHLNWKLCIPSFSLSFYHHLLSWIFSIPYMQVWPARLHACDQKYNTLRTLHMHSCAFCPYSLRCYVSTVFIDFCCFVK
jgi:hypothetical protein